MPIARLLKFAPILMLGTLACSGDGSDPMGPGVEVGEDSLPPAGTAYHGDSSHRFMGGSAVLTCSSHGTFTSSIEPPTTIDTARSDYFATFVGQLVLEPPLVASPVTHPLSLQVHMAELITLAGTEGTTRTFDAELATFELGGTTAPAGVMVRESPSVASTGRTTITALSGGGYHVETYYDVWLELSLDGGGTWQLADNAVHMTLGPPKH